MLYFNVFCTYCKLTVLSSSVHVNSNDLIGFLKGGFSVIMKSNENVPLAFDTAFTHVKNKVINDSDRF